MYPILPGSEKDLCAVMREPVDFTVADAKAKRV